MYFGCYFECGIRLPDVFGVEISKFLPVQELYLAKKTTSFLSKEIRKYLEYSLLNKMQFYTIEDD